MRFANARNVEVIIPRAALVAIFDECDRYEADETGGRMIGTYVEEDGRVVIQVGGVIGPGPAARRTSTSFFQDGEYQERIFRQIEHQRPDIEHLGNWHTHHVNGLNTLSGGDIATYQRIVNHHNHNTAFFYALLVVDKRKSAKPHERYAVKHYMLRRGEDQVYEIPSSKAKIVDTPLIWPAHDVTVSRDETTSRPLPSPRPERVYDRDILTDFFQGLRPFTSPRLGLYWRGPLQLIDGSAVEIVVVESTGSGESTYSVTLRKPPEFLRTAIEELEKREFPSARAAVIITERLCNNVIFEQIRPAGRTQTEKVKE